MFCFVLFCFAFFGCSLGLKIDRSTANRSRFRRSTSSQCHTTAVRYASSRFNGLRLEGVDERWREAGHNNSSKQIYLLGNKSNAFFHLFFPARKKAPYRGNSNKRAVTKKNLRAFFFFLQHEGKPINTHLPTYARATRVTGRWATRAKCCRGVGGWWGWRAIFLVRFVHPLRYNRERMAGTVLPRVY